MKRLRAIEGTGQAISLTPEEQVHVGVDVHKRSYHVALWTAERGWIATWVQPAGDQVLLARLAPMRRAISHVVYEAGPTGFSLVRALRAAGYVADVVAPSKIPTPPGQEAKSDRIDCRKLAMFSGKGLLHAVKAPTEQQEADRQLVRLREQLVRKKRAVKLQIRSFLLQHGIAEPEGLGHWAKRAVEALRRIEVGDELRFCLDMLLDELQHAGDQVARVSARARTERRGSTGKRRKPMRRVWRRIWARCWIAPSPARTARRPCGGCTSRKAAARRPGPSASPRSRTKSSSVRWRWRWNRSTSRTFWTARTASVRAVRRTRRWKPSGGRR